MNWLVYISIWLLLLAGCHPPDPVGEGAAFAIPVRPGEGVSWAEMAQAIHGFATLEDAYAAQDEGEIELGEPSPLPTMEEQAPPPCPPGAPRCIQAFGPGNHVVPLAGGQNVVWYRPNCGGLPCVGGVLSGVTPSHTATDFYRATPGGLAFHNVQVTTPTDPAWSMLLSTPGGPGGWQLRVRTCSPLAMGCMPAPVMALQFTR